MPQNLGHRRVHSYFSGTATSTAPVVASKLSKARSTDQLSEKQLDPAQRANSAKDLSTLPSQSSAYHLEAACRVQFEEELEQKVQSLISKKKFREITVPNSIKFAIKPSSSSAVAGQSPTMARPRSPKTSYSSETDLLDQTLMNIRKRLMSLNNDRVEMENKMNNLMSGIKEVHIQCRNQRLQQQVHAATNIRRVHSSANPSRRPSNLSVTRVEEVSNQVEHCSQDSADLSQDSTVSASSSQGSCSQPTMRQRAESASATMRVFKPPTLSIQRCSISEETCWLPATTIHELPESPKYTPLSQSLGSTSVLSCSPVYATAPRNMESYRRSYSVSSPPSASPTPRSRPTTPRSRSGMVTSTPNVSETPDRRDYYHHTLPLHHLSHRNSLQESTLAAMIPEDQVDFGSKTESLSQLSTYTDEGSPRNSTGTIVTRRSSLTGQIEQYRKPRSTKDLSQLSQVSPKQDLPSPVSNTYATWTKGDTGFRVLNKGVKKSSKKRQARMSQIILPSVETTV